MNSSKLLSIFLTALVWVTFFFAVAALFSPAWLTVDQREAPYYDEDFFDNYYDDGPPKVSSGLLFRCSDPYNKRTIRSCSIVFGLELHGDYC